MQAQSISESALLAEATLTTDLFNTMEGSEELLDPWDFIAVRNFELNEGNAMRDMPSFCYC